MQFETGGQPEGAESPFSGSPLPKGYPDFPAQTWFDYGYKEGLWRMLDLWDRTAIKVTSHVVGEAALKHPELAKAIAQRGHELGANKRRMMSVSLHDRIGGTPAMVETMERFIRYAQSHPKVSFMRNDQIAQIVLTEKIR